MANNDTKFVLATEEDPANIFNTDLLAKSTQFLKLSSKTYKTQVLNALVDPIEGVGAGLTARNNCTTLERHQTIPTPQTTQGPIEFRSGAGPHTVFPFIAGKYKLRCGHCKKNGHLKDGCFELHGEPDWFRDLKRWRQYNKSSAATTTVNTISDDGHQTEAPEYGCAAAERGGGGKASPEIRPHTKVEVNEPADNKILFPRGLLDVALKEMDFTISTTSPQRDPHFFQRKPLLDGYGTDGVTSS